MTVNRKNTEIYNADGEDMALGTSDNKPKEKDIKSLLKAEGWRAYDIDIWFDNLQGFFRWDCRIRKIANEKKKDSKN